MEKILNNLMRQKFYYLSINTKGQKLYEFTQNTLLWIKKNNFENGILNISIQHTSASLIVQENADLICAGISSLPSVVCMYNLLSIGTNLSK